MTNRNARRANYLDADHQMDLWAAFIDCYTSSETRSEVDKYLRGLFGVRLEPDYGRTS